MNRRDITNEMLKEFWKHKIHPITGYNPISQRDTSNVGKERKNKNKNPLN